MKCLVKVLVQVSIIKMMIMDTVILVLVSVKFAMMEIRVKNVWKTT